MKKIIILSLLLNFSISLFSQKETDIVDYKKINIDLLNNLIGESLNKMRDSLSLSKMKYDESLSKVTKFQNDFISGKDVLTHENNTIIKNKTMKELEDRLEFFNPQKKYLTCSEISMYYPINDYSKYYNYTYGELSELIIKSYMNSIGHKLAITIDGSSEFQCDVYFNFKTSLNIKNNKIYNTGVIVLQSKKIK